MSPEVANDNQPVGGDDGAGGYAPLAVAVGSGTSTVVNWVHGNHLGVPLSVTSSTGAGVTPTGYTMAGFPGQTRTLGDLYYNRYRDYDSSTGRYIQADPIGLGGGSNDYVYAGGNPLRYADPSGLQIAQGARAGAWLCGEIGTAIEPVGGMAVGAVVGGIGGAIAGALLGDKIAKHCSNDGNGGDSCVAGWLNEVYNYCATTFSGAKYRHCKNRANDWRRACKRERGHWPPSGSGRWSYQDEHRFRP